MKKPRNEERARERGKSALAIIQRARKRRLKMVQEKPERTCVECGCTEGHACPGGCSWAVEYPDPLKGLCSQCA